MSKDHFFSVDIIDVNNDDDNNNNIEVQEKKALLWAKSSFYRYFVKRQFSACYARMGRYG